MVQSKGNRPAWRSATLAVAVLAGVVGAGMAPRTAFADTVPSVKVTTQGSGDGSGITVGGPATDVKVDVVPPAAGSTVLRVVFDNAYSWEPGTLDLTVADAQGKALPVVAGPLPHSDEVDIPNPTAGGTHLLVSAIGPMAVGFEVSAELVDSATNQVLASDPGGPWTHLTVYDPTPTLDGYCEPGNPWVAWPGRPVGLQAGGYPVRCQVDVGNVQPNAMGGLQPTLSFSADQVKAAGYSARQLARLLIVSSGPYDSMNQVVQRSWSVHPDGSLSLDLPALKSSTDPYNGQLLLSFVAGYGMHTALLKATLGLSGPSGSPVDGLSVAIKVAASTAHDFNGDGKPDLYFQSPDGVVWLVTGTGNAKKPFGREYHGQGFLDPVRSAFTVPNVERTPNVAFGKLNGTGELDALAETNGVIGGYSPQRGNFSGYNLMTGSADLTGGAYGGGGNMIARDKAGQLWLYPAAMGSTSMNQVFGNRNPLPGNWAFATAIVAAGDLTGDGRPDLLARAKNGVLWLFPGTGNVKAPFGRSINLGGNWNWANTIVACGDMTGDGKPDLLLRTAAGNMWLYPGTGNAKAPFGRSILAATGWKRMLTIF